MKKLIFPIILSVSLILVSCAELMSILESVDSSAPLTENEVINGLKEALSTGASNSAKRLAAENGYYSNLDVKILLPDEADIIIDNISKIPGGDKMLEDVVLRINRAAEDAAKEVAPIFVNSVRQMSIQDAFGILKGNDDAATQYLRNTTYDELFGLYSPKIKTSVQKDIIGNISTQDSWDALTGQWNKLAVSVAGRLAGLTPVNTDLGEYLTNKALGGMFLRVAEEEYKIRKDINARISPLLKKVFGSLDNK